MQKGYLREADYTRKTQELSQMRQQATEVLEARDLVEQNPQALRQFLSDEHILKAFSPQELLVAGLSMNGVDPNAWNQFLKEFQENGGAIVNQNWRADPHAPVLGSLQKQVGLLTNKLTTFEKAQLARESNEKNQREMRALSNEVDEVLKKYPGVHKEEVLLRMLPETNTMTTEQIAKSIKAQKDSDFQNYIKGIF